MENAKLEKIMVDIYYKHTCMVICKNSEMNEISEFINNKKEIEDVLIKMSLADWEKKEDEYGVLYEEQFCNIVNHLMKELSSLTNIAIEENEDFENDVSNTLIPMIAKVVKNGRKCFIIIENFECINNIFPDDGTNSGMEHFPLEQLAYLSVKNGEDTDTLGETYVVLLSEIPIEDVEIYKYKSRIVASGWPYETV